MEKVLCNSPIAMKKKDQLSVVCSASRSVLKSVCHREGVQCIKAPGEADWYVAFRVSRFSYAHVGETFASSLCAQLLHTQEFLAVVGRDTDFLVYRGCRCILEFDELLKEEACMFTQQKLADWLGFEEDDYDGCVSSARITCEVACFSQRDLCGRHRFLDCMLMRGTDYTKHYLQSSDTYARIFDSLRVQVR